VTGVWEENFLFQVGRASHDGHVVIEEWFLPNSFSKRLMIMQGKILGSKWILLRWYVQVYVRSVSDKV